MLPPPERRGRKGIYNDAHLSRLRIINRLLERDYTLANIGELIGSWECGNVIGQLLGLETAVSSPWTDEIPDYPTMPQLVRKFGRDFLPEALRKAIELGVIRAHGAFARPSLTGPHLSVGRTQRDPVHERLVAVFPGGERMFIDAVREYRDEIPDPDLKKAAQAFIGQEAMHSREHIEYNDLRGRWLPAHKINHLDVEAGNGRLRQVQRVSRTAQVAFLKPLTK